MSGLPISIDPKVSENDIHAGTAPGNFSAMLRKIHEENPWSERFGFEFDPKHYQSVLSALRMIGKALDKRLDDINFLRFRVKEKRLITYIGVTNLYFSPQDKGVGAYILEELAIIEANSLLEWESNEKQSGENFSAEQCEKENAPPITTFSILDKNSVNIIDRLIENSDREQVGRLKSLRNHIAQSGVRNKPLVLANDADPLQDVGVNRYPNFSELLNYLQAQIDLAKLGDGALRIPPTLLVGPPGVGKTTFLQKIARRIGADFHVENIAAAQTGARLAGSEIFWANNRPGVVFSSLVFGKCANPIIVLDELDKENGVNGRNTLGALYELLEPATAARFQDASLPGVHINASNVIWFATANNAHKIDPVILSRFRVIEIPEPTRDQMPAVVASVYADFIESAPWGHVFPKVLEKELIDCIGTLPPREVRKAIERACGNAAKAGRKRLEASDIDLECPQYRVGFI